MKYGPIPIEGGKGFAVADMLYVCLRMKHHDPNEFLTSTVVFHAQK